MVALKFVSIWRDNTNLSNFFPDAQARSKPVRARPHNTRQCDGLTVKPLLAPSLTFPAASVFESASPTHGSAYRP